MRFQGCCDSFVSPFHGNVMIMKRVVERKRNRRRNKAPFGNEITNLNRYKWKRLKAKEMSETKVRKEE